MKLLYVLFFLLVLCSCSENFSEGESAPEGETYSVRLRIATGGMGAEAEPSFSSTRALLTEDTKVRVLVYKVGGQSSVNYLTEKVFSVGADGTTLNATDGNELKLIAGTYDFYAMTPGEIVVNHTGNVPTVEVDHHLDYAVSLTSSYALTPDPASAAITLTELDRKCVRLTLSVTADTNATVDGMKIKKLEIRHTVFTGMTAGPLIGTGTDALPATALTGEASFADTWFATADATPRTGSGDLLLLPKAAGTFGMKLKLSLTLTDDTVVEADYEVADITDAGLLAGHKYALKVTLSKSLTGVSIAKWNLVDMDATDLGS